VNRKWGTFLFVFFLWIRLRQRAGMSEVTVTAGANQAFVNVLLATTDVDDTTVRMMHGAIPVCMLMESRHWDVLMALLKQHVAPN
jgi:aspartate/methionine/tyrosine aminotransferase